MKIAFSLKCCISALPELNQSLLDFFNLFDSRLILTLLYDSLNLVIIAFGSELLGGMIQEKGSRERHSSWTVLHAQCTSALSSGFPLLEGNAEAGKQSIVLFLTSNTSAKNYRNQVVCVKTIASQR